MKQSLFHFLRDLATHMEDQEIHYRYVSERLLDNLRVLVHFLQGLMGAWPFNYNHG